MDKVKTEVDAAVDVFMSMLEKSMAKLKKEKAVSSEEVSVKEARLRSVATLINVGKVFKEGGGLPTIDILEAGSGNNIQ